MSPRPVLLLIQTPQSIPENLNIHTAKAGGYYAYPPAGLFYLNAALEQSMFQVHILDLNLEMLKITGSEEKSDTSARLLQTTDEKIQKLNPGFIGISCMFDLSLSFTKKLLENIRDNQRCVTITGGVTASYKAQELLKNNLCHFVIRGEGEDRLNHLLQQFEPTQTQTGPTDGIFFKPDAEICESEGSSLPPDFNYDLTDIYEKVNLRDYASFGSLNPFSRIYCSPQKPFATIQLNRGCRGKCSFCSVRSFMGRGVRSRSTDGLLQEICHLYHKHGVRHFEWLDDDLLYNRPQFAEFLRKLAGQNLKLTWSANNGVIASCLNDEILELMAASGCIGFKIGFESGDENILRKFNKPGTIDSFRRAAKAVNRHPSMFVGGNFMLGFPEENFERILSTFRFFLELQLDWGAFTICQSISGAPAFAEFATPATNFIPSRGTAGGRIETEENIPKNMDIFLLSPSLIPSDDQLKEIWFTFNLLGNYILNKNLSEKGNPEKFARWVEAALISYPENPYMNLFLALASVLNLQKEKAEIFHKKAVELSKSDYWKMRFTSFGLNKVLNHLPLDEEEVYSLMQELRQINGNKAGIITRNKTDGERYE